MRHLLRSWDGVRGRIASGNLMLLLDYDGTLSPIVGDPSRAALPARTRRILRGLSTAPGVRIAVISGRALRDVRARVGVPGVICAGNHGMEVEGPMIRRTAFAPRGYARSLSAVRKAVAAAVRPVSGALVEDKGLSFSVHYRMAARGDRPRVRALFRAAVRIPLAAGAVRVRSGKRVLEVLPPVDWDKGRIALWLAARRRRLFGGARPLAVYVGDDATDEDAFRALGRRGITVRVGGARRSAARYRLRDTREVAEFLVRVLAERSRTP